MQVILLKDIDALGKEGDTVKVKDGYARNYLIARKLALRATPVAVKAVELRRKKFTREKEREKAEKEELAKKLSQLSLTIPIESGVNDALFGSVTPDLIAHALREEGFTIDKRSITLKEPIKKLGIYSAEAKLHPEVKADLRIWVVKK